MSVSERIVDAPSSRYGLSSCEFAYCTRGLLPFAVVPQLVALTR